jgi:hypothetical protein
MLKVATLNILGEMYRTELPAPTVKRRSRPLNDDQDRLPLKKTPVFSWTLPVRHLPALASSSQVGYRISSGPVFKSSVFTLLDYSSIRSQISSPEVLGPSVRTPPALVVFRNRRDACQ